MYDAVISAGGPVNVLITPELLKSVKGARTRYGTTLEKKRETVMGDKEKENERFEELQLKRLVLQSDTRWQLCRKI